MSSEKPKRKSGKRGPDKHPDTPESRETLKTKLLEIYAKGGSFRKAAEDAGTSYGAASRWLRTDPVFAYEIDQIRKRDVEQVEASMRVHAVGWEDYDYGPDGMPKKILNPDKGEWEYKRVRYYDHRAAVVLLAAFDPERFCPQTRAKRYEKLASKVIDWWPEDDGAGGKLAPKDQSAVEELGDMLDALAAEKRGGE